MLGKKCYCWAVGTMWKNSVSSFAYKIRAIMKQFVKALDKDGDCFQYICKSFASLDNEKLKAGIFDGRQIRQLMRDQKFYDSMNEVELAAWLSFVCVVKNFLGNYRDDKKL